MKYNEDAVEKLYQENLNAARQRLASLPVAEGRIPNITGLNGWVYEQTIRYCLCQELIALGLSPIVKEQLPLYGRVKIDLLVGRVAIEIKALGSFGDDAAKYGRYRAKVEEKGWVYCYLTRSEMLTSRENVRVKCQAIMSVSALLSPLIYRVASATNSASPFALLPSRLSVGSGCS